MGAVNAVSADALARWFRFLESNRSTASAESISRCPRTGRTLAPRRGPGSKQRRTMISRGGHRRVACADGGTSLTAKLPQPRRSVGHVRPRTVGPTDHARASHAPRAHQRREMIRSRRSSRCGRAVWDRGSRDPVASWTSTTALGTAGATIYRLFRASVRSPPEPASIPPTWTWPNSMRRARSLPNEPRRSGARIPSFAETAAGRLRRHRLSRSVRKPSRAGLVGAPRGRRDGRRPRVSDVPRAARRSPHR